MIGLTYKKSGVDIDKAKDFKNRVRQIAREALRPEVLKELGGFGGFFSFTAKKFKDPVLVSSADGVGTKLKIAVLAQRHNTVGVDAVAMNVNDILCCGATPLFFLDYIAYSELKENTLLDLIKGVTRGCREAGCALVGGETAQMPGMYRKGEYDLAGFCVGVVEKSDIIDGNLIEKQDVVLGLASSGLHSNGFSLVRKVLSQNELLVMAEQLLTPTRIYARPLIELFKHKNFLRKKMVKGIAHITGGAFYDKISRILPNNVNVCIQKNSWPIPKIFRLIQNKGRIQDKEMYRTFNMGVGMVVIVGKEQASDMVSYFKKAKVDSWVIGRVVAGKGEVEIL